MQPDTTVRLVADGTEFAGWKGVRVRRSMTACAGQFELQVSELWPGGGAARPIVAGSACELLIGDTPVITGYVDTVDMSIDAGRHEVRVSGRDKTGDLVDCGAVRRSGQWRNTRIEQIAADLCAPFGVRVKAEVDTGKPLSSFALQEGETVFEAIERAARIRSLLVVSDSAGALVLTRAGLVQLGTSLVLGENALAMSARVDMRDRFSEYAVKGQAPGNDFFSGAEVAQIRADARDPNVKRYRPLVLTNDAPDLGATLRQRVQWEANRRAARSTEVDVTVQGWRHDAGLWMPNVRVPVVADALRIYAEMLVVEVELDLGDQGSTTRMVLTRADAFQELPLREAAAQGAAWFDLPKAAPGAPR